MLVLSGVDDKPLELFTTSLVRAKFCELVGEKVGRFSKDSYFTVGLFSCLDSVMDTELSVLLEKLGLDAAVHSALLNQDGELGLALNIVKGIELGKTDFSLPGNLSASEVSALYLQAMQFAESIDLG